MSNQIIITINLKYPTWTDTFDVPDGLIQLLLFKIILNTL